MTRIPRGPYSTATARVRPSTAAFAVAYGVAPGTARCAWWEETLTIAPGVPAARKRRTAVAQPTTAGARFSRTRSSTSAGGAVWSEASRNTAALLTQPASGAAASARSAARSATAGSAASPATTRARLARRVAAVEVDRDDGVALGEQAVDDGAADPARAAGDDVGAHAFNDARSPHRYTFWIGRIDRFRACWTRAGS